MHDLQTVINKGVPSIRRNKVTSNGITPTSCQKEAIKSFHKSISEGKNKMAFIMATATGKTNVAIWCIEDYLKKYGFGKVLFVAHLDQIWQQADERFKQLLPSINRGFFVGREKINIDAGVITAGVVSLAQGIKNKTLPFKKDHFNFIVIDEFHHSSTGTYKTVLNYFKPKVLLGMSCLKERHDQKDFLQYFGNNIVYEIDTVTAIEQKAIAGLKYYAVKDDINYKVHKNGYKYTEVDQNRRLIIPEKDKRVIEKYLEIAKGKKTIAFCATIAHARRMTEYFIEMGVSAVAIHHFNAQYPDMAPKSILQKTDDFKNGKYQVACTVDKWLEGADFPDAEVALLLRPTKSWRVFIQSRGRVLRLYNGKKYGIVIDAVGNHKHVKIYRQLLVEHMVYMKHQLGKDSTTKEIGKLVKTKPETFVEEYKKVSTEYKDMVHSGKTTCSLTKGTIEYSPGVFEMEVEEIKDIFFRTGELPLTKKHLIRDYFDLKNKLGRQPKYEEYKSYTGHGNMSMDNLFGKPGWFYLVKKVGGKVCSSGQLKRRWNKEEVIQIYVNFKKHIGRQPSQDKFKQECRIGQSVLDRLFGKPGFKNMIAMVGDVPYTFNKVSMFSRQHLLNDYFSLKKELGRQPMSMEYGKKHHGNATLCRVFGRPGWSNMLKELNEEKIAKRNR